MSKLTEIIEIVQQAKEAKDLADLIIPEIYPYIERFSDGITDLTIRQIKRYQEAGFSKEEAMQLAVSQKRNIFENMKNNTGK